MKRVLLILFSLLALGLVILMIRAYQVSSHQKDIAPVTPVHVPVSARQHLAEALRYRTISQAASVQIDSSAFRAYLAFLAKSYPLTERTLEKKCFNELSCLYKWEGTNASLKPMLLLSHYDVVPVEAATRGDWLHPPFSGEITGQTIWGRGAIDDKMSGIAILEAIEMLIAEGYQPARTVYLSLGHDEERGGPLGAAAIAAYLRGQGVELAYVLDEGGAITQDIIPEVRREVAFVGIAEKGYLNLELSVQMSGGHSSIPLDANAIDVLSQTLAKLKANPFPARVSEPLRLMFEHLGPETSFGMKMALANADILEPLLLQGLALIPQGKANIRTTMVPTVFASGVKENVIPKTASAIINLRILPGETVESAIDYVQQIIADDRITVKPHGIPADPSVVSDIQSAAYQTLYRTIREVYPDVVVVPNLLIGGTDSRYFQDLTDNTFRFRPFHIRPDNAQSFHGVNERMTIPDLEDGIRFFRQLIRNNGIVSDGS